MKKSKKDIYVVNPVTGKKLLLAQNVYVFQKTVDNRLFRYYIEVSTYEYLKSKHIISDNIKETDFSTVSGFVELVDMACLIVNR